MNRDQRKYLLDAYDLGPEQLDRLLGDLAGFLGQTYPDWIRMRHRELQSLGVANEVCFSQLKGELGGRLFGAPELSVRQIRRIIYG